LTAPGRACQACAAWLRAVDLESAAARCGRIGNATENTASLSGRGTKLGASSPPMEEVQAADGGGAALNLLSIAVPASRPRPRTFTTMNGRGSYCSRCAAAPGAMACTRRGSGSERSRRRRARAGVGVLLADGGNSLHRRARRVFPLHGRRRRAACSAGAAGQRNDGHWQEQDVDSSVHDQLTS
jgi:hypothetical protein